MSDQPTPDGVPRPATLPGTAADEAVSALAPQGTPAADASGGAAAPATGGASSVLSAPSTAAPTPAAVPPSNQIALHEVAQMAGAIVFVFCFVALGLHAISYAGY
ncbi:hypothetical protein K2X14_04360 [Acetobacter sp. TBRC 12305]|uniref:Uncharacterized protein n=1 Tax=Acetobacter garciniae TaxID=2817435 RepID=A0A939HNS1_9PROT|nr:hypothetical protein [Acetobacter garciniae]MBO1324391.1 hypothetical protein [Acetobacter garciniae]MBX0344080.1 hypothetical protein [Acetobacter garciniae]